MREWNKYTLSDDVFWYKKYSVIKDHLITENKE